MMQDDADKGRTVVIPKKPITRNELQSMEIYDEDW